MEECFSCKGEQCENTYSEIEFLSRKILDLNKQLIDSGKAKSRFLSLVANALNNPIAVLLSMIPHLKPQNDLKLETIYALVHEQALTLDFRIQNLVAAAEIENGEVDISYASVDIKDLVDEAIKALRYTIEEKQIRMSVENTVEQKIVGDPQRLYLIFRNLIDNACNYGKEKGNVIITVRENDSRLHISVKNDGEGPKVEYKAQVYTRFAAGPEGAHGLGLGLSIVRDLSELMDGSIDYQTDGTSVTFMVDLPLQTALENSEAFGSNDFFFESFDDAIEL
ncbi:MAG: HAMP domain-containing histidine kinase [Sulfuricurvum sp.]|jgi:signal transduction histidine kinase|uniref:sensor histidine kinase n=1 Tax=Sulfuricurvum sp. TaxID=2025608 RepID=UPI0025F3EDC1|nr:HAMP domain-containing sensor histidine kinase [Sulfuricurvum sp.]MCK9371560.1 HAMP domain-containing histidine kinase [Sulfuricurvum sp.]